MNTTHTHHLGTELRRSAVRLVTASAIGVSALSIALAAPAVAKGPHPGPVIDRPEPTSSLSAQNNDGGVTTAPVNPVQHLAPGAIPRSQPSTSIKAQQNASRPAAATEQAADRTRTATAPSDGSGATAKRADARIPTMPGPLSPADAGRLFGGMRDAS